MLRRLIQSFLLFGTVILSSHASEFDQSGWDELLKKHVVVLRDGQVTQVDYAGLQIDRTLLKQYLSATSELARSDFDRWSKPEQLAFLLNTYYRKNGHRFFEYDWRLNAISEVRRKGSK